MNIENILENYRGFLAQVLINAQEVNMDLQNYEIDHIAYRCPTLENYELIKGVFKKTEQFIGENLISNRPISIFKLSKPLGYEDFQIPYLELIAPKDPNKHITGLQHIEILVNEPLKEFIQKHPDIEFNTEDITREINPEIDLEFEDGTEIKFHNIDIETAMKRQVETGKL